MTAEQPGSSGLPGTGLSVIIPVHGRVALLRRQLESLTAAAAGCTEHTEILVVDDSEAADAAAHKASCAAFGARYLRGPRHVGAKRNLGARYAAHDILVFADSDQRSPDDLLQRFAEGLRRAPKEVAAITGPVTAEEGDSAVFRVMRKSYTLLGDHEDALRYHRMSWFLGGNTAMRREAFDKAGGFPEDSPAPLGGEDVHLGLKLTEADYVILCDRRARAVHDAAVAQTMRAVAYRLRTYGRSEIWLCTAHPERREFRLNVASLLAVTALASLCALPMAGPLALAAGPVAAGAVVGVRVLRELRRERSPRGSYDALARTLVELIFDWSACATALRMRRPGLLFAGFRPPTDEAQRRAPEEALPLFCPAKPHQS